jgi:hypothetical protein
MAITNRTSNGGISVSTITKGQLIQKTYFGYRICEAKKLFKKHLKTI